MPIGAGRAPAGSSIAGYGVPDAATGPNPLVLPDFVTSQTQTGRAIDPTAGDYLMTADGRLEGMSTAQQVVTLAIKTVLNSSAVSGLGQSFTSIREKGTNFPQQVSAAITSALAAATKANLVKILRITVFEPPSNPDAGVASVRWKDVTTGLETVSTVGGSGS